MSLFELPVSRGARLARVAAVLLLDLVLAGAGIAMLLSYLDDRAEAAGRGAQVTAVAEPTEPPADVDALDPAPVDADEVKREPTKRAREVRRPGSGRSTSSKPVASGGGTSEGPADRGDPPAAERDRPPAGGGAGTEGPDSDIDMGPPAGDPGGVEPDPAPVPGDDGDDGDDGTLEPEPDDAAAVEFTPARVRRVVDRHRVQLQKCYQRAAKSASLSKPLEGRVDVQFVIMPDGHASNVRPVANTTGSDQLAECVTALIESWQFPSPGAEEIAFVWPFVFRAP